MTRLISLVAVLALGFASCAGDDDDIPAATSTTRAPTSTTAVERPTTTMTAATSAEAEITRRYEAFWDARFAANQPHANPDHPGLREYATGAQLENVIEETKRNRDDGIAFRRPADSIYERRVTVIEVENDTARLQDCVTNDGVIFRVDDGEVIDDSVATKSLEVAMRLVDGRWKVERTTLLQQWEGVRGCALAGS